jgi:hypothetical protein
MKRNNKNSHKYIVVDTCNSTLDKFVTIEEVKTFINELLSSGEVCEEDLGDTISIFEITREVNVTAKMQISIE